MQPIRQIGRDDCGMACLKMMLHAVHQDQNYLFLPQDENHGPYSFNELIKIGKKYELYLTPIKVDEKESVINCSSFPFIALIKAKNDKKHFILIEKIKRKTIYFIDPASGKEKMKLDDFFNIWDGHALIIDHYQKTKCSLEIIEPINKKERLMSVVLQIVALAFAFFGVYTLSDSYHPVISVLFFIFAGMMELALKFFIMQQMRKLDDYFFLVDNLPPQGLSTYFKRYEQYKKNIFSLPFSFVLSLIVTIGLMIIIIMNDLRNYIIVCAPTILAIIQYAFINPYFAKKERLLMEQEQLLDKEKDKENFIEAVDQIHKKAYDLSFRYILNNVGFILILLLSSIFLMVISGVYSFPYILFNCCLEFALYRSLNNTFAYPENRQKFFMDKIRLNNMFYFQNKNNSQK